MKVHEYQAKEIFRSAGLSIPTGKVFDQSNLVLSEFESLNIPKFVVKAQIHAGGRGKAGGVKLMNSPRDAYEFAKSLIGKRLVTFQSGSAGQPVDKILVEAASILQKELYLGIVIDREESLPCIIFSDAGGMEIEEVAKHHPEKILKLHFEPKKLPSETTALELLKDCATTQGQKNEIAKIIVTLARVFVEKDAALVEINPLGILQDGSIRIVDAKISFDLNALYRHPDLANLRDIAQEDAREVEAKKFDLSYVGLDGNIGCMVNGAGLAMATMDVIKLYGGEPANFLDVGGGASVEKVTAAFKIILADPQVKAILVNIFGGIMQCDIIAQGILTAVKNVNLKVPLVVRLEGTKVEEGKKILKDSGLKVHMAATLTFAAKKVVELARIKQGASS